MIHETSLTEKHLTTVKLHKMYTNVTDGVTLARPGSQVNYVHKMSIIAQVTWEIARCKLCTPNTNFVCVRVFACVIHT